jgi:molybdenum cofactor cytidylyltransferase
LPGKASMISAILLGAGEGKRMGKDKLSLPLGKKTVFERSLEALVRSDVDEVLVVVREKPGDWRSRFRDKRVKFIINPDFHYGMSTSVRKGIRAMDSRSQGVLIALGDQPFLKPRTINALIRAFSRIKGGIVLPVYHGKKGHPVLFDRSFAGRLLQLEGDVGGRSVVEEHRERVVLMRTRSKAVLQDIDTWNDYRKACKKKRKGKSEEGEGSRQMATGQ